MQMIPSHWRVPSHALLLTTRPTDFYAPRVWQLYVGNAIRIQLGLAPENEASCNELLAILKRDKGVKYGWHGGVPTQFFEDARLAKQSFQTTFSDVDTSEMEFKVVLSDMGPQEGLVQVILAYRT